MSRYLLGALGVLALVAAHPAGAKGHGIAHPDAWWTHAVIYEIYPRSFKDSNGDGIGDLNGITAKLDYLKSLGIDAIWLTPFYPSPNADFGYDVSNYTAVAPEYGTMADWDRLVRAARARGIRILVDFVVNHSSDQHPWFIESRSSRTNPKRDWYVWRDGKPGGKPPTDWLSIFGGSAWTKDAKTGQYYYHIFLPQQPDLNWRNPGVKRAMFDVMRFWLKHGASGFRLDATPYLVEDSNFPEDPDPQHGAPVWLKPYSSQLPETNAILRQMRSLVDSYPGHPVLLGESATRSLPELRAVYGKDGREISLPMDFLVANLPNLDAGALKRQYDDAETRLDGLPPVFFFSSHDRTRQWSHYGDGAHDARIARITATLTLATRGVALLYYGEEIGMADAPKALIAAAPLGPKRPRADERDVERTPMAWNDGPNDGFSTSAPWLPAAPTDGRTVAAEDHDPASLLNWYRRLIALRHDDPLFRDGAYRPLSVADPHVFAFARTLPDGRMAVVAVNTGDAPVAARVTGLGAGPGRYRAVMASGEGALTGTRVTLAPYGVLIVEAAR